MRVPLLLLAASLLAAPLHAAPHRGTRTLRAEIEGLEQQWRQAALAGDVTVMDHLLSEDYLGINPNGQVVTKLQQLDRMKSRDFTLTRIDVSDVKIKLISRRAAIVTSLAQVEGTADEHPLHGSFRYTRIYQRLPNGGGWKITSFEATRVSRRAQPAETASASQS
ncbi:MAG TPA: nuclear transport factor 2 family protein [Acidobacteriaceae bacterium]|jgi:ketosteroid isomerase-like protein|nr:nuclear transport factor 2 family protein [Acidobacteriaceae bacterium]